jgi:hypothetical protein
MMRRHTGVTSAATTMVAYPAGSCGDSSKLRSAW